jgi:hypothetical protein
MNKFVAVLARLRLLVILRVTVIAAVPVTTNTTSSHRVTLQWYGKIMIKCTHMGTYGHGYERSATMVTSPNAKASDRRLLQRIRVGSLEKDE